VQPHTKSEAGMRTIAPPPWVIALLRRRHADSHGSWVSRRRGARLGPFRRAMEGGARAAGMGSTQAALRARSGGRSRLGWGEGGRGHGGHGCSCGISGLAQRLPPVTPSISEGRTEVGQPTGARPSPNGCCRPRATPNGGSPALATSSTFSGGCSWTKQ
jgi:hypothetical protein